MMLAVSPADAGVPRDITLRALEHGGTTADGEEIR
jgi:hypothetical protein